MKIVIAGNYGAGNIGDEMILRGLLDSLKKVVPKAEITVLSGDPETTKKNYKVDSVPMTPSGFRSLVKAIFKGNTARQKIKECDYFILGGGGLFANINRKSYWIWGMQAFFAHHYKKPIIMYGQSVDKPDCFFCKQIVKRLFNAAKLIAVRDKQSKYELRTMDIHQEIHLIPDLALHGSYEKFPKKKETLLVALRQMNNLKPFFYQNISTFLDYVIKECGWQVIFVNFQVGKRESDSEVHQEILERMSNKDKVKYIHEIKNPEELMKYLSESKIILGMRLHSIVAAIKAETSFIAINYAPKVRDFLTVANFREYILEMKDIGLAKLKYQFKKINKNYEDAQNKCKKFKIQANQKFNDFEEKVLKQILK